MSGFRQLTSGLFSPGILSPQKWVQVVILQKLQICRLLQLRRMYMIFLLSVVQSNMSRLLGNLHAIWPNYFICFICDSWAPCLISYPYENIFQQLLFGIFKLKTDCCQQWKQFMFLLKSWLPPSIISYIDNHLLDWEFEETIARETYHFFHSLQNYRSLMIEQYVSNMILFFNFIRLWKEAKVKQCNH